MMFSKKVNGEILFRPRKAGPVFVEFQGAVCDYDDDGRTVDYVARNAIVINVMRISGYYDHTILVEGRKIRVMETYDQITKKILGAMR